tara:strand:- start:16 stop:255 length:240 start_codon:yes stop_codon:yes gene_type:complete
MTEQRKKLIDRFQSWLDTDPRKQIIAAVCANIAEEYAEEQLLLHNVVVPKGTLRCQEGTAIDYDCKKEDCKYPCCLPYK